MQVVVDSDGGIDDAAALAWLAAQPDVKIGAVTAVGGNSTARQAARNLRIILERVGAAAIPVFEGHDPSGPAPPSTRPTAIHGHDGLGDAGHPDPEHPPDLSRSAADVLVEQMHAGAVVLAIGPLTNLAAAVLADPSAPKSSGGLVFMGGSARAGGNMTPTAEANVGNDPLAAASVINADWPSAPVMVGLDVTLRATLTQPEFDSLAARPSAVRDLLAAPLAYYRRNGSTFTADGECPCHDLLAAMTVVDRGLVTTEILPTSVDCAGGPAWGMTVVDLRALAWRSRGLAAVTARPEGDSPVQTDVAGNRPMTGAAVAVGLDTDVEEFRRRVRSWWTSI